MAARPRHAVLLTPLAVYITGVYGGYFGAGQGIMLLAIFGVMLPQSLHRSNALKNVLTGSVNAVAGVYFIFAAHVEWAPVAIIAVTSILGAQLGARYGRRLHPNALRHAQDPVLLHEFLHAYHAKLMPRGYENKGIKDFYGQAKAKDLFPKDAYILKDHKEFFAITASIFLSGKDAAHEPFTRDKLKETMPQYYTYLVGVFGFDPNAPAVVTPVASAD